MTRCWYSITTSAIRAGPRSTSSLPTRFDVIAPSHPGYDRSSRPEWMRSVRDVAVVYQWLLPRRQLDGVSVVGLGFGGWIAAEMATMSPRSFKRLVLVGAMGIQPAEGEIMDQALVNYIDYARAGFHEPALSTRSMAPSRAPISSRPGTATAR